MYVSFSLIINEIFRYKYTPGRTVGSARIVLASKLGIPCDIDFAQARCSNGDKP